MTTTRSVVCGSLMMMLAACSGPEVGSSEDQAPGAVTPAEALPPRSNDGAPSAPPAPPAPPAPTADPSPVVGPSAVVFPSNGAVGVEAKPTITVTFSESMDHESTETAFALRLLGDKPLTGNLTWSDDDKVLSFVPEQPLADGADMTVTVSVAARAKTGNALTAPISSAFRVLRKSVVDLSSTSVVQCAASGVSIYIGQFYAGDDLMNKEYRTFATFDLTSLPDDITSIASAELTLSNGSTVGSGSPKGIAVESVVPGPNVDCASDFDRAGRFFLNPFTKLKVPLRSSLADEGNNTFSANVSVAIGIDWSEREALGKRAMVRIRTSTSPVANGIADGMKFDGALAETRPRLTVTYHHP